MRACPVANGCGEVDETPRLWQATRHASAPSLGGYARSTAALGSNLDDAFSAVVVRPAGRTAQSPHRREDGTDIWATQRWQGGCAGGSINKMPHCTSGDATTLGRGRTGGQCRGARAREMTRRNCENCDGDASERAAREEIGRGEPNRWARGRQQSLTGGPADAQGPLAMTAEGGGKWLWAGFTVDWAGWCCSVGLAQRKRPEIPFPF
jgi:hypothetical protein